LQRRSDLNEGIMAISLVPLDSGEPVVLTLPLTLVGRKDACDLRLEDEDVAELHCVLGLTDGLLVLRDLDTGSVRVNGRRVRRAALLPDDVLDIAGCRFRVQYDPDPPQSGIQWRGSS
jgi:hypothetical protein